MSNLSSFPTSSVDHLKANWHRLPDFERAQAVLPIVRAGMSRRHLANALNVSEGTIRNLLLILQANPDDVASFRCGEISQNELLRRVRGPGSVPDDQVQQLENSAEAAKRARIAARRANAQRMALRFPPLPLLPLLPLRRERRMSAL